MRTCWLVTAAVLLSGASAFAAAPKGKPKPPPPATVLAYIVADGDPSSGQACDESCLKGVANKVRGRRGVKKATVEDRAVVLEIQPGAFKGAEAIKGVDGMKVEMRVPYKAVEVRFVADGPFPPVSRVEDSVLIVEMTDRVKKAIESATSFKLGQKIRCFGKLVGPEANEAVLTRYEEEKRPPATMIPFMVEADLDGDRKPDLYLRLEGMPEVVIFNSGSELKAMAVTNSAVEELPRCDATPTRFARAIPKQKIKCMNATPHAGDGVERVQFNQSSEILLFNAGKFETCEPLGEGAMPAVPHTGTGASAAPKPEPEKKKKDDEW
jgi:hypothetical protein